MSQALLIGAWLAPLACGSRGNQGELASGGQASFHGGASSSGSHAGGASSGGSLSGSHAGGASSGGSMSGGSASAGSTSAGANNGGAPSAGSTSSGGTATGGLSSGGTTSQPVAVTTHHNDNQRTGANLSETRLSTANVNVDHFGKLAEWSVDGDIYAQPLYVSDVAIPGQGVHNIVYVASMHNTVFAFDADSSDGSTLWKIDQSQLGAPIPVGPTTGLNVQPGPQDISTEIGTLSTPVIDLSSGTLYLLARSVDNGNYHQKLHALDITTGAEKFGGPVEVQATFAGSGVGSQGGQLSFDPVIHNQRAALLLANGQVYISWAGHNDSNDFHGWLIAFDAVTLQRKAAFVSTPNGEWGGIWQAGAGPAADEAGNIYLETGNGDFDPSSGNYGDSILKLNSSPAAINLQSYFTPKNQDYLNGLDLDLGSAGTLLLPGTHYLVASSKEGKMYLLDSANLGGINADADQVVDEFQAAPLPACDPHCFDRTDYYHIHGSPVYWDSPNHGPVIFVWAERDYLKTFRFLGDHFEHTPLAKGNTVAPAGMPGGFLSLSANGNQAGSGIVWALHPVSVNGSPTDAAESGARVRGILQAFDATDVSKELWNSRMNATRDDFGNFAKFNQATVANGKVYVPTMSKRIAVFGILP